MAQSFNVCPGKALFSSPVVYAREEERPSPFVSAPLCALCLAIVLLFVAGCGGVKHGAANGKVTLDGQPVDGGTIMFIPGEHSQRESAWGQIFAGEYSLAAAKGPAVGKNRVEIRWLRKTGRKIPNDPETDEVFEAVPNRYNRDSQLQVDVKPGENRLDFELRSR